MNELRLDSLLLLQAKERLSAWEKANVPRAVSLKKSGKNVTQRAQDQYNRIFGWQGAAFTTVEGTRFWEETPTPTPTQWDGRIEKLFPDRCSFQQKLVWRKGDVVECNGQIQAINPHSNEIETKSDCRSVLGKIIQPVAGWKDETLTFAVQFKNCEGWVNSRFLQEPF